MASSSQQHYQYSSFSSTSSTVDDGSRRTGSAYQEESHVDPSGARLQTTSQSMGEPAVQETRYFDAEGHEVFSDGTRLGDTQAPQGKIEDLGDVDDQEAEK
jgi:hypothetical protein